ncbi:MAG: polyhydroxyalkanoic acid system family protein [Pseudomonadota bacterium]|nr:polyhydroxyalkanoic acid system family protein [Pseudomonadota bacterium]
MSHISISRKHDKTMKQAHAAVNKVAKAITRKFSVDHQWQGDVLNFSRSGVDGHIELTKGMVKVNVKLGFLLMMLRAPIESEIERVLDEEFA